MKERYVPIRPGISDHLLRGDLSLFEFGIYTLIHLQADFSTGVWRGSAPRVLNSAPRGAKLREVQRALEHLTQLGLLKHFHQQGQRGNFAFLINKFTVRSGALTGMRLNADKSESWRHPNYEPCADVDADDSADVRAQDAPIQEVRRKREEKKRNPAAKPAPPPDPRHQPFIDFAHKAFEAKHCRKPLWQGKDFSALKLLLRSQSAESLPLERLSALWRHFTESTEAFTVKQGDSLAYFCTNIDKFSDGPLLAGQGKEPNGKTRLSGDDLTRANLRAAGF